MTKVMASQKTSVGIATYANSITLTPGTITTGVKGNVLTVHALVRDGAARPGRRRHGRARHPVRRERLMFAAAACAVLVALVLAVVRALKGPTVFDRVLAGNSVGTLAILLLAVVGFLTGRPEWLDIGITYGLLNVICDAGDPQILPPRRSRLRRRGGDVVMQPVLDIVSWALILAGSLLHGRRGHRPRAHARRLHAHARRERHRHAGRRPAPGSASWCRPGSAS